MDEEGQIDQPDTFDLELELVRWVKIAGVKTIPPVMCKPAGPIIQHYGLDSKSRWREAVCIMMLVSDPHITNDGVNKLGRQLAQLFRQDLQLWEVKARQLHEWVKRGLTNVKLLDRTLAYFQNQTSWLQYIKTLKNPIPMIESPGFPGTQWNEFYWKEQTVMLLMQEQDFSNGKNPDFCSRLFGEEPGKWKLKMEQFKRWIEKGKNDPLPEYYGTGKNCPECGLFLWDTRSFLKHMKRNHGLKIRDKEKFKENSFNTPPQLYIPGETSDTEDSSACTPTDPGDRSNPLSSPSLPSKPSPSRESPTLPPLSFSPSQPVSSASHTSKLYTPHRATKNSTVNYSLDSSDSEPSLLSLTLPVRTAASRKESPASTDELVSCPECSYRCSHSKIINHLIKCKKAHQANKPDPSPPQNKKKVVSSPPKARTASPAEPRRDASPPAVRRDVTPPPKTPPLPIPEVKESLNVKAIVKKVFWKKYEAERLEHERNMLKLKSPEPYKSPDSSYRSPDGHKTPDPDKPPLKLKLSRKEGCQETPCFEINKPVISSILRQQNFRRFSASSPQEPGSPCSLPRSPVHVISSTSLPSPSRVPEHNQEISDIRDYSTKPEPSSDVKNEPVIVKELKKDSLPILEPAPSRVETMEPVPQNFISESADVGRLGRRRGRMIACPLCGVEYALASNLEKHIDKDHKDTSKPAKKRARKTSEVSRPKKMRKFRGDFEDTVSITDVSKDPGIVDPVSILNPDQVSSTETVTPEVERRKMTEYEIFQSLQLHAERKPERKKVSCDECGKLIPPNNIKRHLERHEKIKSGEITKSPGPGRKLKVSNQIKCGKCEKMFPKNLIKRHLLKHKREEKVQAGEEEGLGIPAVSVEDDRIPCVECGKMLPKNAMKRHMMKHEVDNLDSGTVLDSESIKTEVDSADSMEAPELVQEKRKVERKKMRCEECGMLCAPNTFRRHLDKHRRGAEVSNKEVYAPIEITPTKEYWEMQSTEPSPGSSSTTQALPISTSRLPSSLPAQERTRSGSAPSGDTESKIEKVVKAVKASKASLKDFQGEDETDSCSTKKPAKDRKSTNEEETKMAEDEMAESTVEKNTKPADKSEPDCKDGDMKINKNIKDLKEQERSRISGSEEEGETPLELAVRKVVSYKMTPKQALTIYNLQAKVLFDNLLGETDEDRMAILNLVDLTPAGEQKIIQFCVKNEEHLSYKSVINYVKELKFKDGNTEFNLSRLQAYRWWYAFRKKFDLKITAKKK